MMPLEVAWFVLWLAPVSLVITWELAFSLIDAIRDRCWVCIAVMAWLSPILFLLIYTTAALPLLAILGV
jgi:hypothetical protein